MNQYKVIVWRPRGIYRLPETIGMVSGDNEEQAVKNWIEREYEEEHIEAKIDNQGFWRLYDEAQLPIEESFFLFEIEGGK